MNEKEQYNTMMSQKVISILGLSPRANNCLRLAGVETIDQLQGITYEELSHMENMDKTTADEILKKLEEYNLWKEESKNINLPQEDINILGLSPRANNCLKAAGIYTIDQLQGLTKGELKLVPRMGNIGAMEILEKLEKYKSIKNNSPSDESDVIININSEIANKPIKTVELSRRNQWTLSSIGIETVGDLIKTPNEELIKELQIYRKVRGTAMNQILIAKEYISKTGGVNIPTEKAEVYNNLLEASVQRKERLDIYDSHIDQVKLGINNMVDTIYNTDIKNIDGAATITSMRDYREHLGIIPTDKVLVKYDKDTLYGNLESRIVDKVFFETKLKFFENQVKETGHPIDLDTPIESFCFPVNTMTPLSNSQYKTLGSLVNTSVEELEKVNLLGQSGIKQIMDVVNVCGYGNEITEALGEYKASNKIDKQLSAEQSKYLLEHLIVNYNNLQLEKQELLKREQQLVQQMLEAKGNVAIEKGDENGKSRQ